MDLSRDARAVLERYRDKTHLAGGPRAGYVLRRTAIGRGVDDAVDLGGAIAELTDGGLLSASENGDFLFLTESGVEAVTALD